MDPCPTSPLHRFLSSPVLVEPQELAARWHDQTATFRLAGAASFQGRAAGAHLRRSFLGALGAGASGDARQGRPCPWEPPCALDVFRREQMRGDRGDGLPKPYVIFTERDAGDLLVSLRVFGRANIWFAAAIEGVCAGMRDILPWQKAARMAAPAITDRRISRSVGIGPAPARGTSLTIEFLSPVDVSGVRGPLGRSLVSRMLRRASGMARWHGLALAPDTTRRLTACLDALDFNESGLVAGRYLSPNRHAQKRAHETREGLLRIHGDLSPLLPLLAIAERCHVGRAAVEGLGRFRLLDPADHGQVAASART